MHLCGRLGRVGGWARASWKHATVELSIPASEFFEPNPVLFNDFSGWLNVFIPTADFIGYVNLLDCTEFTGPPL